MSSSQALTQPKTKTNPALKAIPAPQATLPDASQVIGELVEAYLKAKGAPQMVADETSEAIQKAAKQVPNWVLYLIFAVFGPLCMGIYAQYQTYKDLPSRMSAIETTVKTQGADLQTIKTDVKTLLNKSPNKE